MATKPPSKVKGFSAESLEKISYNSVRDVPTVEPNDSNRLGYHIFLMLKEKQKNLDGVIMEAESRLLVPKTKAAKIIRKALKNQGIIIE